MFTLIFEITGAKVAEYHAGREAGSIIVRVTVTPKRDIVVRETKRQCAEGRISAERYPSVFRLDEGQRPF